MLDFEGLRRNGFRPYRKTTITFAKQMKTPFAVRLLNGDQIYGQRGDYACVNPGSDDRWIINRKVFEQTYETHTLRLSEAAQKRLVRQGFRPYRKHQLTWAKKLSRPQLVRTLEGDVRAEAGDYLCTGANGEQWPQKPGVLKCIMNSSLKIGSDPAPVSPGGYNVKSRLSHAMSTNRGCGEFHKTTQVIH